MPKVVLRTNFGEYPDNAELKNGVVTSDLVDLQFNGPTQAHRSFKDMVRGDTYDAGELAVATLLQAKARGLPLVMLPIPLMASVQHDCAIYSPQNGKLSPRELRGKSVGIRSYSQTTGLWLRGILRHEYGVNLEEVVWHTLEEGHVSGYLDPPNSVRLPVGANLEKLLLQGDLSAIIQRVDIAGRPELQTLIPDPQAEAARWFAREGILPVNHVLVVHQNIARERPDVVRELFRMVTQSRRLLGSDGTQTFPVGLEANRRWLEIAIDWSLEQKLIDRRIAVDALFDDISAAL
jgi:4,5-dihydroxyphthalate decarboxylase